MSLIKNVFIRNLIIFLFFALVFAISSIQPKSNFSNKVPSNEKYVDKLDQLYMCRGKKYMYSHNFEVVQSQKIENISQLWKIQLLLGRQDAFYGLLPDKEDIDYRTFKYHEGMSGLAYVTGNWPGEAGTASNVYLYFLETKENRLIYSVKNYWEGEYLQSVKDIGFSKDGNLLAITTGDSLLTYDLNSKVLTERFKRPRDSKKDLSWGGVFGYEAPIFNFNNTKILLKMAYYEGSQSIVFDLINNFFTELPYTFYYRGDQAIGWDEEEIIVKKLTINSSPIDASTEFVVTNLNTLKEKSIIILSGVYSPSIQYPIVDDNLLLTKHEYFPSGQEICNNALDLYEVTSIFDSINLLNLTTGDIKELIQVDATNSDGTENKGYEIRSIALVNNDNSLYIDIHQYGYGLLHLDSPYKLTKFEY